MSTWKKDSLRSRAKSLAKGQEEQELLAQQLVQAANGSTKRLEALEELVAALCHTVGVETIQEAVQAQRRAAGEARVATEAQQLQAGIEAGYISPAPLVDEDTFVVVVEHDKEGSLCYYGPQQSHYQKLQPESQKLLLGQSVGYKCTTSLGNTYELTGVYRVDAEKAKAYFDEQQKKAAEKQVTAQTEAANAAATTPIDDLPSDVSPVALGAVEAQASVGA